MAGDTSNQTNIRPEDIEYTALFVDDPAKLLDMFPARHAKIFAHHSTNWFRPTSLEGLEIGKKDVIEIVGEAQDDACYALLVRNPKSKNSHPHITISCAEGTPPVYSNDLLERASKDGSLRMFDESRRIEVTEGFVGYVNGVRREVLEYDGTLPALTKTL